jgi:uncharacterized secreted protein with C-terminal beta-propeller domain
MTEAINTLPKFSSEEELTNFLVDSALEKYHDLFGTTWTGGIYFPFENVKDDNYTTNVSMASGDHSETNTQVQGVDESDIIKTDGNYIYLVDNSNTINIIDVNQKATPESIAQVEIEGAYIEGIYLHDDGRMTVVSTGSQGDGGDDPILFTNRLALPYSWNPVVNVTVLDISNPDQGVTILETTQIEGSLIETRALNDRVYVVTESSFGLEAPQSFDTGVTTPPNSEGSQITASNLSLARLQNYLSLTDPGELFPVEETVYQYETEAEYLARIDGQVLQLSLPSYTVINQNGEVETKDLLTPVTEIYQPLDEDPWSLKTVSVFNPTDDQIGVDFSTAIPEESWGATLYMSPDNLYLGSYQWDWETQNETTGLLKLDLLDDGSVALTAEGEVPGYLLNQFSLDEYEGMLRVATTINNWDDLGNSNSQNNVYVLEQNGQKLEIIGQTDNLAPGERIYSTRFEGDIGYVVTFRQVDPLFAVDLSNPSNPEVISELKVPGFSEYLQIVNVDDQSHLLGIGRDADTETGMTGTLKLSLFDLEDPSQLTEVDNYLFPEQGYIWSPASWEHHAVSYYPEWQVLAIPFQNYNDTTQSTTQGLRLFQLDGEQGITPLGDITHDTSIERSLRIGEYLVSLSDTQLTVHQFQNSQFTQVGEVDLLETTYDDFWSVATSFLATTDLGDMTISVKEATQSTTKLILGSGGDDLFDSAVSNNKGFTGEGQILFTSSGNDTVDVSLVGGNNWINTSNGDDIIFAGYKEGGNRISTGTGTDEIWLMEDPTQIPLNVNKITDFDPNYDVIGFKNTNLSWESKGIDWNYEQKGSDVVISVFGQEIAYLLNLQGQTLTEANFAIS